MKEINLEEILFNTKFKGLTTEEKESIRNGLMEYSWEEILEAMKQACLQILELCAENAKLLFHNGFYKENKELTYFQSGENNLQIFKQSILNLRDKIK